MPLLCELVIGGTLMARNLNANESSINQRNNDNNVAIQYSTRSQRNLQWVSVTSWSSSAHVSPPRFNTPVSVDNNNTAVTNNLCFRLFNIGLGSGNDNARDMQGAALSVVCPVLPPAPATILRSTASPDCMED